MSKIRSKVFESRKLKLDLIQDAQYPVKARLPNGTVKSGVAVCNGYKTVEGYLVKYISEIIIDSLEHTDELDSEAPHDYACELIMYAINEGDMASDNWDSGFSFEISDLNPIELISYGKYEPEDDERKLYEDGSIQITLKGQSSQLLEFFECVYHACDCTFNRAEVYPELGGEMQTITIHTKSDEWDTVKLHLRNYGISINEQ